MAPKKKKDDKKKEHVEVAVMAEVERHAFEIRIADINQKLSRQGFRKLTL